MQASSLAHQPSLSRGSLHLQVRTAQGSNVHLGPFRAFLDGKTSEEGRAGMGEDNEEEEEKEEELEEGEREEEEG